MQTFFTENALAVRAMRRMLKRERPRFYGAVDY